MTSKKYEIQTIKDKEAPSGYHYRITEIATDSRVATCYLEENAKLVCDALNERTINRSSEPQRLCAICGNKTKLTIHTKSEANELGVRIGDPVCWDCLA